MSLMYQCVTIVVEDGYAHQVLDKAHLLTPYYPIPTVEVEVDSRKFPFTPFKIKGNHLHAGIAIPIR